MKGFTVAVVAGGPSSEAEVSRTSAAAVLEALTRAGHTARVLELDRDLCRKLDEFDVVFPITHGPLGEDGCLQGLLEVLGLPYVGSGVLASALGASKPHAKRVFTDAGLPVPRGDTLQAEDVAENRIVELRERLGRALVAKPASGGSAIGVELIKESSTDAEATAQVASVLRLDVSVLVEEYVPGAEITCGVLERGSELIALPPTAIHPNLSSFYDFASKYRIGGSEHRCPAPLEQPLLDRIQRAAVRAHTALGCRDLSRIDFLVDPSQGSFVVLEANTLPGMTATSLFPEAAAVLGIGFEALCDELVRRAVERPRLGARLALPMP